MRSCQRHCRAELDCVPLRTSSSIETISEDELDIGAYISGIPILTLVAHHRERQAHPRPSTQVQFDSFRAVFNPREELRFRLI
jgi:hypothetical protein